MGEGVPARRSQGMQRSKTIAGALDEAKQRIGLAEARVLLRYVLGCSHAALATHPERELIPEEHARLLRLVQRRSAGEPVAYLICHREFYGREFRVSPDVLIPRPETELLVDLALERMNTRPSGHILDLGTGSGVLAVTLALELPGAQVTATDDSDTALAIARANAQALGAPVRFVLGDWFRALRGEHFDLIVANPPYVAAGDPHLDKGDLRFEPIAALSDGSPEGLGGIRTIVAGSQAHLFPDGWLLFEHGYDQSERCRALLRAHGYFDVSSWQDLAGIERISGGWRKV